MEVSVKRNTSIYRRPKGCAQQERNGTTEVDMEDITMRLYCAGAGLKEKDGKDVYVMPFKYRGAAEVFSQHPKFGRRSEKEEKALRDSSMRWGESSDSGNTGGMTTIGKRPRGMK